MDLELRDLERRAIYGDHGARDQLRANWMRLRDPRNLPQDGDVLLGLSQRSRRRRASDEERAVELERLARGLMDPCSPGSTRSVPSHGRSLARYVTEVSIPTRTVAELEALISQTTASEAWRLECELQRASRPGGGVVTWREITTWDGRRPVLEGKRRSSSLRAFRAWARWSVALHVAEELAIARARHDLLAAERERVGYGNPLPEWTEALWW